MVQARLSRRLRHVGAKNFGDYLDIVEAREDQAETREFISLLTTNMTSFFREPHHFELFRNEIFPPLHNRLLKGGRVRIWSAGCSFGNEPYSIAMICRSAMEDRNNLDLKILATDIDAKALQVARAATYQYHDVESIPENLSDKFLVPMDSRQGFNIRSDVKSMITFRELNIQEEWPMQGRFDVIFCRNMLIYFDKETQSRVLKRLADVVPEDGWLVLGHSERLPDSLLDRFKNCGPTTYMKTRN